MFIVWCIDNFKTYTTKDTFVDCYVQNNYSRYLRFDFTYDILQKFVNILTILRLSYCFINPISLTKLIESC